MSQGLRVRVRVCVTWSSTLSTLRGALVLSAGVGERTNVSSASMHYVAPRLQLSTRALSFKTWKSQGRAQVVVTVLAARRGIWKAAVSRSRGCCPRPRLCLFRAEVADAQHCSPRGPVASHPITSLGWGEASTPASVLAAGCREELREHACWCDDIQRIHEQLWAMGAARSIPTPDTDDPCTRTRTRNLIFGSAPSAHPFLLVLPRTLASTLGLLCVPLD
ncbi:hypothetical protein L226DRAFT_366609 [Lentinus tigrinus ALCF2SS1-7]|uniref:uncharacterized protein n=1 Tax=Lentinus tigrinus ALCF2SS1-7 TaxID=1328758 RepID=UPI0011661074|nr:hypothetical protein L226DRAFT_366609 [Lentinus tigrinus ALCF2SS1-7]